MPSFRMPFILAALMVAASMGAMLARPSVKLSEERTAISLQSAIPTHFGDWHEIPQSHLQVVNPQAKELLDKLYSEILTRIYVNATGYRIMLSIAYGSDQRGSLQAHKPEACYPAQGFIVETNEPGDLATTFGAIPVRYLLATMGPRREPLTYWFTVGSKAVQGTTQKRLVDLRYGLTGRIPDGLLFRVSSIDPDPVRAYESQQRFVNQLLASVSPDIRKRLSGLGDP